MKKALLAGALMLAAASASAEVCTLFAKDGSCTFATDTSGGTTIFSNPTNLSNIGSGVITPFLGTQQNGTESGVTTDIPNVNLLPLTDKRDNANTFTNTFTRSDLGVVTLGGTDYYQFFLDTNEPSSVGDKLISIDTIRIWDAQSAALQLLTNQNVTSLADVDGLFSSLIYAMGPTNQIVMDGTLFSGSGLGYDLSMLIPVAEFAGVALDSRLIFGTSFGAAGGSASTADGFEEWAYRAGTPVNAVPEPGSLALCGVGLLAMRWAIRRGQKKAGTLPA
jgi:hypothetical protein